MVGLQYSLMRFKTQCILLPTYPYMEVCHFRPSLPSSSLLLLLHTNRRLDKLSVIKHFDGNICTQCVCGPSGNLVTFAFHNPLGPKQREGVPYLLNIPDSFSEFQKVPRPCRNSITCTRTFEDRRPANTRMCRDIDWKWQVLAPK